MKTILTSLLLIICLTNDCQSLKLSKTDKTIITTIGATTMAYGFIRKDLTPQMKRENNMICIAGVLFAVLPYVIESKKIEFTGSGVNIKLKYKRFKCKHNPYKK